MTYDAMNNSDQPSPEHSSSGETEEARKPFVQPELRRETDLLDGTGSTVSWSGD